MATGSADNKTVKISIELPGGLTREEIEQYRESLQQLGSAIDTIKQSMERKSQDSPSKLLPCPFCGSPAMVDDDDREVNDMRYIYCANQTCGACTGLSKTITEAARRWNRRDLSSNRVDPDGPKCYWFDDEDTYRHWKCEMDTVEYVMYRLDEMLPDEHHPPTVDQIRQLLQILKS